MVMSSSKLISISLILVYAVFAFSACYYSIQALRTTTIAESLEKAAGSRWIIACYADFATLSLGFILPYIWSHHQSRGGTYLSRLLWVVGIFFCGNVVLMFYLIWTLLKRGIDDAKERLMGYSEHQSRTTSGGVRWGLIWFLAIVVGYTGVTIWASIGESLGVGWSKIKEDALAFATFIDLFPGFVVFVTIMTMRDNSWKNRIAWIIAIVFLGGGTTAFYSLLIMFQATKNGESYAKVLLTPATSMYI